MVCPNVGSPAPLFTLKDINGKELALMILKERFLLTSGQHGASPVRSEMDDLESAYKKNNDKGLVILGVMLGGEEGCIEFLKRYVKLSHTHGF